MKKLYYFLFALLATATLTAQTPATHEVAVLAEDEISGQCGENLYWHYADGTLTITGSGEMFNYTTSITGVAPWNKFRNTITQVVMPKGLTTIGSYAFDNCKALSTLTVPDSVTMIGNYAFRNCSTAYAIILGERLTNINNYAFYGCRKLTNIFIKAQTQPVLGEAVALAVFPRLLLFTYHADKQMHTKTHNIGANLLSVKCPRMLFAQPLTIRAWDM